MGKKKPAQNLYTGRSGQHAAMSEFLIRGYNVAIPEVDVGEDVFVVRDRDDAVTRVQVKSANARPTQDGYYAQFKIPLEQLEEPDDPPLVYVFPVRHDRRWADFIVIPRAALSELHAENSVGSPDEQGNLILRLAFTATDVRNKGTSFQPYRNVWEPWPPLLPPA